MSEKLQCESVYLKKLHKDRAERGLLQCQLLQVCVCVSLFFFIHTSFPCTIFSCSLSPKSKTVPRFLSHSWTTTKTTGRSSEVNLEVNWNLGITKDKETGRICSLYNQVSFIEILFHTFYYNWGKENRQLHQGIRHIEVPLGDSKQQ